MQFLIDDIKNDDTFQEFLDARGITEKTRKKHTTVMRGYCNLHRQTPTELIDEAEKEQDDGVKRKKRKIRKKLIRYVAWLRENNKASNTIKVYLADIKAFYDDCEIDIPKLPRNICENKDLKLKNIAFDEVPSPDHVKKACSITTPRNKAMILLHFSSGMGSAEVRERTYKDYLDSIEEYLDIDDTDKLNFVKIANMILKVRDCVGIWKIARYKKARPYVTFNSPESTRAIAEYLLCRVHDNKPILSLDDYLFVTVSNEKIRDNNYTHTFSRLNNKCGFGKRSQGNHFFTSHRLRVAFGTAAKNRGIDPVDIRRMLGQRGDELDDAYLKTTAERLKREYMRFVQDLSVEKLEVIEYGDKEVREMARKIEILEKAHKKNKEMYELYDDPEVTQAIIRAKARKIQENK